MLSLKFKRMCSRVIASLSAMGIISIAGSSGAEGANFVQGTTYQPGNSFTYTKGGTVYMTAKYDEKIGSCKPAYATLNHGDGTYSANDDNTVATCSFKCGAGTYFKSGSSYVTGYTQTGAPGTVINGTGQCWFTKPACAAVANATIAYKVNGTVTTADTGKSYFTCDYTCANYYHVSGKADSVKTFISVGTGMTSANMSIAAPGKCVGNSYTVTFDCGDRGLISGTSNRTAEQTATYGAAFTIAADKKCAPKTSAWTWIGWQGT